MATNPEQDEYLDEDERDDIAQRSIFSAGWFRALLVLTVLAIVVVVSLPYLLNWLDPTPATAPKPQTKASEPTPAPAAGGSYWVQVGAFVQERNAEDLAKTLRAEQFPVEIARLNRGGGGVSAPAKAAEPGGQNQLVITG